MPQTGKDEILVIEKLAVKIDELESRLQQIEGLLANSGLLERSGEAEEYIDDLPHLESATVESKVGEYGLAWLGAFVLFLSMAFLMTYLYNNGHVFLSTVLGYSLAAGLFLLTHFMRSTLPYLVSLFKLIGHILIYYTTLRLHYFLTQPLISSAAVTLLLLAISLGSLFYIAMREKSELLGGLTIILLFITAIVSDSTHILLAILGVIGIVALIMFTTRTWWRIFFLALILVYLGHLMWLLSNPLMGHPLQAVSAHQYNLGYLAIYAVLFTLPLLVKDKERFPEIVFPASFLLNGAGFSIICWLVVLTFFQDNYTAISGAVAIYCILFSILIRKKTDFKFAAAYYACAGFMALSIAVATYTGIPDVYPWLALQSLLVVSMALWFRSRFIIVVNTFLFLFFFLAYIIGAPPAGFTSFTFVIVALASARIMNWQKERLALKTEMMRNTYLASSFFGLLYGLYHAVPQQHITLAWAGAATLFFLLSIWLRNVKYRWLAILTLVATCIYLFAVDLARMGIGYSIVAFLIIAIISLSASLYYAKRKRDIE